MRIDHILMLMLEEPAVGFVVAKNSLDNYTEASGVKLSMHLTINRQ